MLRFYESKRDFNNLGIMVHNFNDWKKQIALFSIFCPFIACRCLCDDEVNGVLINNLLFPFHFLHGSRFVVILTIYSANMAFF